MAYIQDWGMRVQAQPQINTTRRAFLHLSQNENGRMLNIRITDVNIPAGSTAVLAGTKPDGTVYSQTGTLAGNTATFAEDVQMTAVAGTWDAKITITNGGNCICTARITITIDPDTVAGGAIPSDSQLDGIIAECRAIADSVRKEAYGSPLVADAVEDMTDQSRVYVYTGSESGMTAGHWYYYNGTAWADGGVYNAVAVDTDTTLSIAGKAADAKEVGDQLTSVKENFTAMVNSAYVTDSASGSVAHFEDGADDVPMKSVKVNIAPVQSGSGDPSPDNVRPISGHSGTVKVYRSGEDTSDASEFSVALNGVVYGGTLDMVSGVLTVDRASVVMDGSTDEGWYVMDTANIFRANAITPKPASGATAEDITQHPALSNRTNVTRYNYNLMKNAYPSISFNADGRLYLAISADTTTIEQATAWLSQNNLQVCYYLDTPQTIQLTGVQIKSLLGINNVWSDSGDVEVEYRADTKLYIDKRLGV